MSMTTEERACTFCGYPVVLQDISDAHGPGVVQFIAPPKEEEKKGAWGIVEKCPNCRTKLEPENTYKVKS